MNQIPLSVLTDSYKVTHFLQYPVMQKMTVFGAFRKSYDGDQEDQRIVFHGIRYLIDSYICKKWTEEDLARSEAFFSTHHAGYTAFPWPKELFHKIVNEYNGYFPVTIQALPEGSVVYPNTPVLQITGKGEFAKLTSYLETILCMLWYPSTVATLSRRCRDTIETYFTETVDKESFFLMESRLHDFGFRGCTSIEQAMIGGSAHLLNFQGTDTLVAAYHTQYVLNNGNPVGTSIPASEHSVMTCFDNEKDAMLHMIGLFGDNIFACVMDSYDYVEALESILPSIASAKTAKGGFMVLRPDSGDPVEVVLQALRASEKVFGAVENSKGFKVLNGVGVIQGDGISPLQIEKILAAAIREGFSAQNIAFGMGSALLQKVHRDVCSFAMKASHVEYTSENTRDLIKFPKTDSGKISLPGEFAIAPESPASPLLVYPLESVEGQEILKSGKNELKIVYDCGPVPNMTWDTFECVRQRLQTRWSCLPPLADPLSSALHEKISRCKQEQCDRNLQAYLSS